MHEEYWTTLVVSDERAEAEAATCPDAWLNIVRDAVSALCALAARTPDAPCHLHAVLHVAPAVYDALPVDEEPAKTTSDGYAVRASKSLWIDKPCQGVTLLRG